MSETTPTESVDSFPPRSYQVELMKIALKKNTIIFLPTGSGKTYIAIMVLKTLASSLSKPYSEGGKITILLVNSIALVAQHAKNIKLHTHYTVGCYTGEMNLDFWSKAHWTKEFDDHQILIMTSQIATNITNSNYLDLNKVNLIIFDECHRAVNDHCMRQLMVNFQNVEDPPRVLGLTATLLNGNCKAASVMTAVNDLEVTFHSQVATVDELVQVVGYSTNPKEHLVLCEPTYMTKVQQMAVNELNNLAETLGYIELEEKEKTPPPFLNLKPLDEKQTLKELTNLIKDLIIHIEMLGVYGGAKACVSHMIQLERIKLHCGDIFLFHILNTTLTIFGYVRKLLTESMKSYTEKDKLFKFSSDKVIQLLIILDKYKDESQEELCGIIFVQRRFTAKVINLILVSLSQCDPHYSHIKSNFMVGHSNNPYNDTREPLYITKKNKQILESFSNKEINVLVSSNLLEEGVDVPKCTLVIKFDKPEDYRSYIQSKGRARYQTSLYYILVEGDKFAKYNDKYKSFQEIEAILNNFLIGKNTVRDEPSKKKIEEELYEDAELPPYFVNGPGSAQINMLSSIPLLCQYCNSLPRDKYTVYAPDWFLKKTNTNNTVTYSVVICMPIVCPLLEPIIGPPMRSVKSAKRAAAQQVCILLYETGELDDHLIPKKCVVPEEDVNFLFGHYPEVKETLAGTGKYKRMHPKQIPDCIRGQIIPNETVHLSIIELNPEFARLNDCVNQSIMYDSYCSNICFGIITPQALPNLCSFPVYTTQGTLNVKLAVNVKQIVLDREQILLIRRFHCLIFKDILEILRDFLLFDNSENSETLLLVPFDKTTEAIDFSVLQTHKTIRNKQDELTSQEKMNLVFSQENYLHKIVTPWYRRESATYIVTEVKTDMSPLSKFPNEEFDSFCHYFNEKYEKSIINPNQFLLLVRGLTKSLNFFKPKGAAASKRKRDKLYEELDEILVPELIVKHDFPSSLWIQASLLPTILSRLTYLLRLEELRSTIARETGLGVIESNNWKPLELDKHLLNYVPYEEQLNQHKPLIMNTNNSSELLALPSTTLTVYNKDFQTKMLEAEFPWKDIDEPKDLERVIDVSLLDVEHYERFICCTVKGSERTYKNSSPQKVPALTYYKNFEEKSIKVLTVRPDERGPELCEIYRAMTSAKANDIVNLERLETLGDSFLKYISSTYIHFRFPQYNEGKSTMLKGRLVSNKNIFYLARKKNLGGIFKYDDLNKTEWLPPCFCTPNILEDKIMNKQVSISSVYYVGIGTDEQITGVLDSNTIALIKEDNSAIQDNEEEIYPSLSRFFKKQYVGDKFVADTVEALIGAYLKAGGIPGATRFVEWMNIIPPSENITKLLKSPPPDPILDKRCNQTIDFHIPNWKDLEKRLGYTFKDPNYLLQAVTHSSYVPNRLTSCYQKLEFLGDAVVDFLITCYIYESCGYLSPGQLTDLRSALVNNNTFASFVVRNGFHKFLLLMNSELQHIIDKFAEYLEIKNYEIDDEVLILLEEDDCQLAEYVDVPKVLGDVFEALAGAVYLDCGKDLTVVWKVFYKLMWQEIDKFSQNVPLNVVRRLFEWNNAYPQYGQAKEVARNKVMVSLQFMSDGRQKLVHGFGSNKALARKAAAKIALRSLEKA